jgi:hypothetical protein
MEQINILEGIFLDTLCMDDKNLYKQNITNLLEIKYHVERELNNKKRKKEEKFHCNNCLKDVKKSNAKSHIKGKKHIKEKDVNKYEFVIDKDGILSHVDYQYLIEIQVEVNEEIKKRKKAKKYACYVCDKMVSKVNAKKHIFSRGHIDKTEEMVENMY